MKVVLVDDHALFRRGVRRLLADIPGYEVVGEAATALGALDMIDGWAPDIVLMDITLPGVDGIVASRDILRRSPKARVLIVSAHEQINDVVAALAAGAAGYALKGDSPDTLLEAIRVVCRGDRYIASSLAPRLAAFERGHRRSADVLSVLSTREREVFRLAAECMTVRDIAQKLGIARKTADTHLNRINRKLGLRNMAELVRLAAGLGLIPAGAPPRLARPLTPKPGTGPRSE